MVAAMDTMVTMDYCGFAEFGNYVAEVFVLSLVETGHFCSSTRRGSRLPSRDRLLHAFCRVFSNKGHKLFMQLAVTIYCV